MRCLGLTSFEPTITQIQRFVDNVTVYVVIRQIRILLVFVIIISLTFLNHINLFSFLLYSLPCVQLSYNVVQFLSIEIFELSSRYFVLNLLEAKRCYNSSFCDLTLTFGLEVIPCGKMSIF
jgi:hypothetical protein